jgi:hypothetical protein
MPDRRDIHRVPLDQSRHVGGPENDAGVETVGQAPTTTAGWRLRTGIVRLAVVVLVVTDVIVLVPALAGMRQRFAHASPA